MLRKHVLRLGEEDLAGLRGVLERLAVQVVHEPAVDAAAREHPDRRDLDTKSAYNENQPKQHKNNRKNALKRVQKTRRTHKKQCK